jgi:phosphomannomutase
VFDVYTGFKWIAAVSVKRRKKTYIGGGEEARLLLNDFVRDRCGFTCASLLIWGLGQKIMV